MHNLLESNIRNVDNFVSFPTTQESPKSDIQNSIYIKNKTDVIQPMKISL